MREHSEVETTAFADKPYVVDIARDGEGWRFRRRWRQGVRRFLPALWHSTTETGLRHVLGQGERVL
jgi:hypothetical protein